MINLSKENNKFDLSKEADSLSNLEIILGWEETAKDEQDLDLDIFAACVNSSGKLDLSSNLAFYNNDILTFGTAKNIVHLLEDNLTGGTEHMLVNLEDMPSNIHKVIIVANIYKGFERKQSYQYLRNVFLRIEDRTTKEKIVQYNLAEHKGQTVIIGELYREGKNWSFRGLEQEANHNAWLNQISSRN